MNDRSSANVYAIDKDKDVVCEEKGASCTQR